jgi:hypothetical protein
MTKPHVIALGHSENRIWVRCHDRLIAVSKPNEVFHRVWGVTVAAGDAPLHCAELVADISNGDDCAPGLISFCSRDPDAVLIPDHVFIRTRGYEAERRVARTSIVDWDERSDRITCRGARDFDTEVASARERVYRAYAGGQLSAHGSSWLQPNMTSRHRPVASHPVCHEN